MATQLTYALSTTPGPLTAGLDNAIITITATNNSGSVVSLQGLSIGVSTGTGANNLTNNPGQMNAVTPVGWQEDKPNQTQGSYTLVFTPTSSPVQVPPNESLVFTISNIQLNNMAGASDIIIIEGTAGNPSQALSVSVFPGGWGNIVFSASPTYLDGGGDVILSWNGPSGATYELQYTNLTTGVTTPIQATLNNYGVYPGANQQPLNITATTLYTLTVTAVVDGTTVTATPQVTVAVVAPPPQILSFTTEPEMINANNPPATIELQWTTSNATVVEVAGVGNFNGAQAAQGSVTIPTPNISTQYLMTAFGNASPPATQNYWLICQGTSVITISIFESLLPNKQYPLNLINGVECFSLQVAPANGSTPPSYTIQLPLSGNVLAAPLSNFNADYETLIALPYSSLFNPFTLAFINTGENNPGISPVGLYTSWALKFPDGHFVTFQYTEGQLDDSVNSSLPPPLNNNVVFGFYWIVYKTTD